MPNTSIGGLVSGLDTATIISQLMQLEARPQTMLKSRVSNEQKVVTALQALNTKLAGIATKAADLAKASAWSTANATSDNEKVTVTTASGAVPATLALTVEQVATSHTIDFGLHALSDKVTTDGSTIVKLDTLDGKVLDLDTKDGTVQGLVNAINSTDQGVKATLVKVDAANYRLTLTSTTTGPSSDFELQDVSGLGQDDAGTTLALVGASAAGLQARIKVGADTISSDSNTFTGLMPGVDVTLGAGAKGSATITVEQDVTSLTESVKAMVESVNGVLSEIGTLTSYDAATKKAGLLGGDSMLRGVRNDLIESVSRGVDLGSGAESLAGVGIQVDRYGKLTFDEAKLKSAYAADPTKTAQLIGGTDNADGTVAVEGFADKLAKLGKDLSSSTDGTITKAIQSRQSSIKGMEDDIADWDIRLATRQTTLQRQYTALETALGKLQSQSSWLAGQIGSLPKMSSQ
jgi:flagellar hook-associated protein 2